MQYISRNFLLIVGLAITAVLMWYFSDIVTYLLVAWVLSLLGRPLMDFFTQKVKIGKYRIGNAGAAVLTIFVFFAILIGLLLIFVPTLVHQANNLAKLDYASLGHKLEGPLGYLTGEFQRFGILAPGESLAQRTQETLLEWFKPSLVSDVVGAIFSTAGGIVVAVSSISFILFFFLEEKSLFPDIIHAIVPAQYEDKVLHANDESSEALTSYFKGLLIQLVCFSVMITVFSLILGIPNALLIGVAGGLLNVVPFVGPIIGMVFAGFLTLSSSLHLEPQAIGVLLLKVSGAFLVTQAIDNLFLSTIIFSKSVKAHPLEIFIVTLIAAKVGGVAGMVVGIPVYTVIRVIARNFFNRFKFVQKLTDHLDEDA
jgi:predicted PurR-regulated permease PerM